MRRVGISLALASVLILAVSPIVGSYDAEISQRTVIARYGKGYLEEDAQGNQILHLKGSPYEMGYQQGVLLSEGVEKITHDYVAKLLFVMMSLDISGYDLGVLWTLIRKILVELCLLNEKYIPEPYRLEMQGVADGAGDNVTYEDVLLLNEAIDVLMSSVYFLAFTLGELISIPLIIIEFLGDLFEDFPPVSSATTDASSHLSLPMGCNEFAVFGEGTTDGRLFHGRDFMFANAGILQDYTLMRVAEPDEGYPFISSTAPGFVGLYDGMNIHGISIGTDMGPSRDNIPFKGAEGTLFVCRDVVQYASTLDEGIEKVRDAPRGSSWDYVISDGKIPDAAVLETSAHFVEVRRPQDKYPDQVEEEPCLIAATNHYIHPKTKLLDRGFCYYGAISMAGGGLESEWRYNYMVEKLVQNYSKIDVNTAKEIIDFLHPPNYDYLAFKYHSLSYTDDSTLAINGSISLFDPGNLEIWSLYGYYDRPWVHYSLKEELGLG